MNPKQSAQGTCCFHQNQRRNKYMSNKSVFILKFALAIIMLTGSELVSHCSIEEISFIPELPVPEIELLQPQCFNKEFTLKNKPIDNPDATRVWEYGVFGDTWQAVGEFDLFLSNIKSNLMELYPCSVHCETCDAGKIFTAISGTNYQFMNKDYRMYANLDANKSTLADDMRIGIQDQYQSYLSNEERAYISSFFVPAAMQATGWIPAYMPVVSTWYDLGSTTLDQVTFSDYSRLTASAEIIILAFRVRLVSSTETGPYSRIQLTDIKPAAPSFKITIKNSCPNSATGEIMVDGIVGLIQDYTLIDIIGEAGPEYPFTGTSFIIPGKFGPGSHTLKLSYNDDTRGGCTTILPATVGREPDLDFRTTPYDASCPEKADGSVFVELKTSSGPHEFRLNNTSITDKTGTFTSLDNGTYSLEVYDLCNVSPLARSITISQPNPVSITSISKIDPSCNSTPNGSISLSASGGTTGNTTFSYQLIKDGSVNQSGTGYPDWSASGLAGGSYTVSVSTGSCAPTFSPAQSLSYVQPVNFSASASAVTCFGSSTGSIKVTPSGGNNSYNYYLDNELKAPPFEYLYSGTHTITVKSTAAGCNDYKTDYVTIGTAPKIEISFPEITSPSCFEGNNGKITAAATGGIGAYKYNWISDVAYIPDNSGAINGLIAGNYTLSITDSENCTVSRGTALTEPAELVVQTAVASDAACFGDYGSITISTTGGSGGNVISCFEYSGPVFTGATTSVSVPAGEYYVQAKDKNGCVAEYYDMALVTEPDSPLELSWDSPTFNGFNVSCQGEGTGLITVEATGGNGYSGDGSEYDGYLYSFSGASFQSESSFSGLPEGSHNVRVKDGRGCIVQKSVILTAPASLTLNLVSSSPVKCFGEATGEIIVSASGGIENTYRYSLDGAEILTPGTFSNLLAGTYEIEVSDLNGCRKTIFPSVESLYPPIGIITSVKDVRCFGEGNGEISSTITGGAGGFSYQWEKKTGSDWLTLEGSATNRTNVTPGIYRVKVTDFENCYQYGNAEINEPALLQVTGANSSDIVCLGEKGSIKIDASGGTAGYTYYCSAGNGDIFESATPTLTLPAGTYTTRIKDFNGCIADHPTALQITQPTSALDFTADISSYHGYSVSCTGNSDGWISIGASGGNSAGYSGYKFSIGNNPFQADNSFKDLASGTYNLKVTDARGCIVQKNVLLTQPEPVSINLLGVSKVKCFGASTGEIQVNTAGGVPEYAFSLNGISTASSGMFKDLAAQTYSVEVSDLNGCTAALSAIVEHKNPPISSLLTAVSVRCKGESNGKIVTELAGGTGSFTSSWEKKSASGWQIYNVQGVNPVDLSAGFYRLKSVDSDNCPDIDSVEVKEPEPLKISNVKIKDAVCFGDPGSLAIEAAGGNGSYMYQYSPNNSKIIYLDYIPSDPLPSGFYGLRVTDSKGCAYEDPGMYHITSPSVALAFNPVLSEYGKYNVSCHGNNDGSVSVFASGGNEFGYAGYTYRLAGRQVQQENNFTGLEAGAYAITVTDGRGCTLTKQVTLTEPESAITLKASSLKRPVCVYDSNGAVTLSAAGGSLPYQFSVNEGGYTASNEFTGLPVNKYRFRVRDRNGCAEIFDTSLVNIVSEMTISGDVSDVKCFGENTGSINVHVKGGAAPFVYSWKENTSAASSVNSLLKGTYTILVTDSAGCHSEKMFPVNQPEKPLSLTAVSSPACVALKNGTIDATAQGGTSPYRFAVDSDKEFPLPSSFNVYSGNHKVYVSDRNDCLAETGVYVNVRNTMPDINFMLASSRYELDTLVVIDVSVPPPDEVTWEFSDGAAVIGTSQNMAKVKYNSAGLYPVRMTGLFGTCAYTIEKLLNIAPFDPSAIGDRKNGEGIKSLKITPNPNDGIFELGLELFTRQQVTVRIFDLNSRPVYNETYPADILFVREIGLPETVMPGTYVLRATCENDARSAVFVISK